MASKRTTTTTAEQPTPTKPGPAKGTPRRSWGRTRQERSGRWSAAYTHIGRLYKAPSTFPNEDRARAWLADERKLIDLDAWTPPAIREQVRAAEQAAHAAAEEAASTTFSQHAEAWMKRRTDPTGTRPLAPTTERDYRTLLDTHLLPTFGDARLSDVTPKDIEEWHRRMGRLGKPRQRAKAYELLSTLFNAAVRDRDLPAITSSPCEIEGARKAGRSTQTEPEPATLEELAALRAATPARYRLMVDFAAWCALRYGEIVGLRRRDIHLTLDADGKPTAGVIHVRRGLTFTPGKVHGDRTKSRAGVRKVTIPAHLLPAVVAHLADEKHVAADADALLFLAPRGGYLRQGTFVRWWDKARAAAGRPDLDFHGLRHTGLTYAAIAGASIRELMERAGHTTPAMALHYQHVAQGRDAEIARRLSEMATQQKDEPEQPPAVAAAILELTELVNELRQIIADQAADNAALRAQLSTTPAPSPTP